MAKQTEHPRSTTTLRRKTGLILVVIAMVGVGVLLSVAILRNIGVTETIRVKSSHISASH